MYFNEEEGEDEEGMEIEDLFSDEAEEEENDDGDRGKQESKEGASNEVNKSENKIKKPRRKSLQPKPKLNVNTLMGPNGLRALKKIFEEFKFKGHNHEKEDLTRIIQILQQWMCYRLYPRFNFESNMTHLETLGNKSNVQVYMKKIRMGIDDWNEEPIRNFEDDNVQKTDPNNFDEWLRQEVAKANSDNDDLDFTENSNHTLEFNNVLEPSQSGNKNEIMPKKFGVCESEISLTPEQIERIARNKKLAEERRLARLSSK